jgi:hypothetical protein
MNTDETISFAEHEDRELAAWEARMRTVFERLQTLLAHERRLRAEVENVAEPETIRRLVEANAGVHALLDVVEAEMVALLAGMQ